MSALTPRDRELVALGAAMGSNCIPCVEYHIPESRKVGLTDLEIHQAIQHADKIRQVPARKVLQAALNLLPAAAAAGRNTETDEGCGCGAPTEAAKVEPDQAAQPHDTMLGMMSKMMDTCRSQGQPGSAAKSAQPKAAADPAPSQGCGCG